MDKASVTLAIALCGPVQGSDGRDKRMICNIVHGGIKRRIQGLNMIKICPPIPPYLTALPYTLCDVRNCIRSVLFNAFLSCGFDIEEWPPCSNIVCN